MKIRMLTAIAASALCITAYSSAADAGGGKHGGGGGGDCNNSHCGGGDHGGGGHHGGGDGDYHNGGHHGGHHGGHDRRDRREADRGHGCDDHWDANLKFRPDVAYTRPWCGQGGVGVTIVGIPGGFDAPRPLYSYGYGYGYRHDPYGRRLPY